jgi:hypothetical protein
MSRRKPKPPPLPPGGRRSFTVKVACTDRGQHQRIVLHHLQDVRSWDLGEDKVMVAGGRNESPLTTWTGDGARHYRFRCTRCARDVQLREENLLRIFDALAGPDISQGHPTLDISLLPC